jgi:hypothetical protein
MTHAITIQVLYDDVMTTKIQGLTRRIIGATGTDENDPLCYSDINGRPLSIPPLVFPYRRALYFVSRTAYRQAILGSRPHECATELGLNDEFWDRMCEAVKTDSVDFEISSVCTG